MSMDYMNEIIETLAAAKVAMEENPQLKAQVQSLKDEISYKAHYIAGLEDKHEAIAEAHSSAQDRIAKLEAELEQARFREQATMAKLDMVVSTLKDTVNELDPAPVSATAQRLSNVVEESTAVLEPEAQTEMIEDAHIEALGNLTDKDFTGETENRIWDPETGSYIERRVEHFKTPAGDCFERTAKAEDFSPSSEQGKEHLPYSGKAYSMKPASLTWSEWIDGGGQQPWWINGI